MGVDKKEEIFILKKNVYSLIVIFLLLNSFSNHKVRKELGDFKNDIKARQYSLLWSHYIHYNNASMREEVINN